MGYVKLRGGHCEFWSNIPWHFASVMRRRTTAVRLQRRRKTPERFEHVSRPSLRDLNTWLRNQIFLPETSSFTVRFRMTTSAKERSFCRKSYILLPMRIFLSICHSGKDLTRTNTTAVQVGRMSWLVVKTNTSSKKRRLFSVSNGLNCLVDHFFNDTNGMALGGKFPWTNCLKSRRTQVLNSFLKTYYFILEPNYVTYTLRDSTHEIGGWTNWVLGFCLGQR